MSDMRQDPKFLTRQYQDSDKLNARATIHTRFGANRENFHRWLWELVSPAPGDRILECGCGPGYFWRENADRLPEGATAVLTDLSPGMVAEAEAALAPLSPAFRFQSADMADLPFEDDTFDLIAANHMLYHLPDLAAGLREVRRVLKPDGRFLAATNGRGHMQELFAYGARLYDAGAFDFPIHAFSLENGAAALAPFFGDVVLHRYDDRLEVTKAQPILDYLLSVNIPGLKRDAGRKRALANELAREIAEHGVIIINKATGAFVATGMPAG